MPGLIEFFEALVENKIGYILATNNATKTAEMYVERLAGFGLDIPIELILNSAEATARYLRHKFPDSRTAYVVGEEGLVQAMSERKFEIVSGEGFIGPDAAADNVVVGFTRYVCYPQLASAALLINRGSRFIGTNPDVSIPTEFGPLPGAGSLLAYLEAATGVQPQVIGKPNLPMFQEALRRLGSSPETTAMVGDRIATDIVGGNAAGLKTILLLSGIAKKKDLETAPVQPDCVLDGISELTKSINSGEVSLDKDY